MYNLQKFIGKLPRILYYFAWFLLKKNSINNTHTQGNNISELKRKNRNKTKKKTTYRLAYKIINVTLFINNAKFLPLNCCTVVQNAI